MTPDGGYHFLVCFALVSAGNAALRAYAPRLRSSMFGAILGALVVGLAKELVDVALGGPFSLHDLAWDAVGAVSGGFWSEGVLFLFNLGAS